MRSKSFNPVVYHATLLCIMRFNSRQTSQAYCLRHSRRRFLQLSAAALSGVALSNCRGALERPSNSAASPTAQTASTSSGQGSKQLYLYTWADYAGQDLFKRFTEQTGIEVIHDVYDSNETMLAKLQAGGGKQYSIIYPSDYFVQQMLDLNLLTKLDQSRIRGLDTLRDRWKNPSYDPNNTHTVPFNWGTTGVIYNTKVWTQAPQDWSDLWKFQDGVAGKLTLLDDVREVMGATLRSLGYSYNSTNDKEIEEAYNKLREIKPAVASFQTYGWEDQLASGDLAMCMTFSPLGNLLPAEQPQLKFVIPASGTSLWTDTIAIPVSAPNPDAAYEWINFILQPENAAAAVNELKIATPNQPGFDLLSGELKNNPTLFPPEALLAKCEGLTPVGDKLEVYERFWTQLKSA